MRVIRNDDRGLIGAGKGICDPEHHLWVNVIKMGSVICLAVGGVDEKLRLLTGASTGVAEVLMGTGAATFIAIELLERTGRVQRRRRPSELEP